MKMLRVRRHQRRDDVRAHNGSFDTYIVDVSERRGGQRDEDERWSPRPIKFNYPIFFPFW